MKAGFLIAAAAALAAGSASATMISDTTLFTETGTTSTADLDGYGYGAVNKLDGFLDYVSWTHHYDFGSAVASINNAVLELSLRDDDNSAWDGIEIALGIAENGQWDVGVVSSATYSYNVAVNTLLDGSFSVTLMSLLGDFFIDKSVLKIDYTPSTSVPEPATLSLLGAGLLGAALRYRRRTKKS